MALLESGVLILDRESSRKLSRENKKTGRRIGARL